MVPAVLFLCVFFSTSWSSFIPEKTSHENQAAFRSRQELVDYINSLNTTWKASLNSRFHDESTGTVRPFRGSVMRQYKSIGVEGKLRRKPFFDASGDKKIPKEFDARIQWPYCPSIREVNDESSCGASWAISTTEVIADRICIASYGTRTPRLSAAELISCATNGDGCDGDLSIAAWEYWLHNGIVSGGNFTSGFGCKPYPFTPCDHYVRGHFQRCPDDISHALKCVEKCQQNYTTSYEQDKHYGEKYYSLDPNQVQIKKEIMNYGSVQARFTVHEDFPFYKSATQFSGVYQHVRGDFLYPKNVRVIGWGSDNDVPYWLAVNSWNEDWGEKGLFRIKRGSNECSIEESVLAGMPK